MEGRHCLTGGVRGVSGVDSAGYINNMTKKRNDYMYRQCVKGGICVQLQRRNHNIHHQIYMRRKYKGYIYALITVGVGFLLFKVFWLHRC
jgi:hypothetical protein